MYIVGLYALSPLTQYVVSCILFPCPITSNPSPTATADPPSSSVRPGAKANASARRPRANLTGMPEPLVNGIGALLKAASRWRASRTPSPSAGPCPTATWRPGWERCAVWGWCVCCIATLVGSGILPSPPSSPVSSTRARSWPPLGISPRSPWAPCWAWGRSDPGSFYGVRSIGHPIVEEAILSPSLVRRSRPGSDHDAAHVPLGRRGEQGPDEGPTSWTDPGHALLA